MKEGLEVSLHMLRHTRAFATTRLDYCSACYVGVSLLSLQWDQNAAVHPGAWLGLQLYRGTLVKCVCVHLIADAHRPEHISLILASLHGNAPENQL